jgi:hypothetical protein
MAEKNFPYLISEEAGQWGWGEGEKDRREGIQYIPFKGIPSVTHSFQVDVAW